MSYSCACADDLFNSGAPQNQRAIDQAALIVFVHKKDANGNLNKIPVADIVAGIDQTYLDGKTDNVDPLSRWYATGKYTSVSDVREDPNFQDFDDNSRSVTVQGRRTITGNLISYGPEYLNRLEYWRCNDFGILAIDSCGNIIGKRIDASGDIYPLEINRTSLFAKQVKGSNGDISHLMLSMDYDVLERDTDLRVLKKGTEVTADTLNATGLIDLIAATTVAATTTTWSVSLAVNYGKEWNQDVASGFVVGDFTLYNETTSSAIVLTSSTEAPDGTYALVFPAQTSSDVLKLTLIADGKSLEPFNATVA